MILNPQRQAIEAICKQAEDKAGALPPTASDFRLIGAGPLTLLGVSRPDFGREIGDVLVFVADGEPEPRPAVCRECGQHVNARPAVPSDDCRFAVLLGATSVVEGQVRASVELLRPLEVDATRVAFVRTGTSESYARIL